MNTLHIALVTETYPPEINGVAMTLARMTDALRQRGQRVSLVRPRQRHEHAEAPPADETLVGGLPIPGYSGLNIGLPSKHRLLAHWRRQRPDIVHIATEGPLGWSAMAAAHRLDIPVVAGFHTNFHNYSRHYGVGWLCQPINAYLRHFHNRADLTLVPTQRLREDLETDRYRNVAVMARGVDTRLFSPERRDAALRQEWGVGEEDLAVLYVGRIAPEKNLNLLVRAFEAVRAEHPGCRFILVGDGPEYRKLRRAHPDYVFTGPRIGEDLARHYASADVFLFPSLTETFGNVLLEAMASGLAAAAFDYAAAAEHIRDHENGRKAPFADEEAFIRQAVELCGARASIQRLRARARQTTLDLAWEAIFDQLEAHYHLLLDTGRASVRAR